MLRIKSQLALLALLCLAGIWMAAGYELYRSHADYTREAELRTSAQAQVFAEYSRSTLKRINEFMLDVRDHWDGDWQKFSTLVLKTKANIDDIIFQVGVIDKDGILAFSNLAPTTDRTDLSEREHFKVHQQGGNADNMFVSRPLLGKVSGKWSIQLSRPLFQNGRFNGVVVVSVSPDQFAGFAKRLLSGKDSVATVVRNTGEVMARYPALHSDLGLMIPRDRPFLIEGAPEAGSFRRIGAVDGHERIYGYYTLREYGMTFALGEALSDVLAPYQAHQNNVLGAAAAMSILAACLFFMLFRALAAREMASQQLRAIFELSPDGFVSFDERLCVMYASPAFLRLSGLEWPQIAGLDDAAFSAKLALVCSAQGRFPGVTALREAQLVVPAAGGADPRRHLIEIAGDTKCVLQCALRVADSAAVSQILYVRDVTRETEVDRLKSEFLSFAAHELRTPMTSIYGFAELLLTREFNEADRHDFLSTIVRQSKHTVSIINELLDLVRIDEQRGKDFIIEDLDLRALLSEILKEFPVPEGYSPPAQPAATGPFRVRADRKKLVQAISNVLSNAYKYSPPGCGVAVNLELVPGDGDLPVRACVSITDHGIGMTTQQLARVGERFYRADTSGKVPGTGLGISIAKEILHLHGGTMQIESKSGVGTTVVLCIPCAPAAASGASGS